MTTAATTIPPRPDSGGSGSRWLYGPAADLLLGSGLGYLLTVPVLLWLVIPPGGIGMEVLTLTVGLLIAGPHYGATLLRVYGQRSTRRRYAFFSVYATLGILAATWLGANVVLVGSLMLTLYVSWSPWHFAGQNYGVALMLLGRQGVAVDPLEKRALHLSFVLSFLITLIEIHAADSSAIYAPQGYEGIAEGGSLRSLFEVHEVLRLGVPEVWATSIGSVLGVALVAVLGWAVTRLVRRAGWAAVGPAVAILATQSLWFSIPAGLRLSGIHTTRSLAFTALWISAFHSLQYLWVTAYYARKSDDGFRLTPYLAKCTGLGALVVVLPALVLAPGALGSVPYDAGLALLVFSAVNLHHFVLDGAIWKLRDGQLARALLRAERPEDALEAEVESPWMRAVVWAAAGLAVTAMLVEAAERRAFVTETNAERGDVERAELAVQRLQWLGRESAYHHLVLGSHWARVGHHRKANESFERSIAMHPTAEAWLRKGKLSQRDRQWDDALAAYDAALSLDPRDARALEARREVKKQIRRAKRRGKGRALP